MERRKNRTCKVKGRAYLSQQVVQWSPEVPVKTEGGGGGGKEGRKEGTNEREGRRGE
jgi:hypothetical protein